jgi:LuxR family maltose regulon positive regulatory protein
MAALYQKAAQWYEEHGLVEQAMRLYINADKVEAAADLLEQNLEQIYAQESATQPYYSDHFLHMLPKEVIHSRPKLLCALAWVHQNQSQFQLVAQVARQIRSLLEEQDVVMSEREARVMASQLEAMDLTGNRHLYIGKPEVQISIAQRVLNEMPVSYQRPRGIALLMLSRGLQWAGRGEECRQMLYETLSSTNLAPSLTTIFALDGLVQYQMTNGELDKAEESIQLSLSMTAGRKFPMLNALFGILSYQRGQGNLANQQFEILLDNPYFTYIPGLLILAYSQIWHDSLATGRREISLLPEIRQLCWQLGIIDSALSLDSLEAYADLLNGREDQAIRWAAERSAPGIHPLIAADRMIWIRCHLASGDDKVLEMVEAATQELLTHATRHHNVWHTLEIQVLMSLVLQARGQTRAALDSLAAVIANGVPRGFRLIYEGYGAPMRNLLHDLQEESATYPKATPYVATILQRYDHISATKIIPGQQGQLLPQALMDQLSNREQEILTLLAAHLTNQEIAQTLILSPNTVRNHIANIFQKLHVSRRRDAIQIYRDNQ